MIKYKGNTGQRNMDLNRNFDHLEIGPGGDPDHNFFSWVYNPQDQLRDPWRRYASYAPNRSGRQRRSKHLRTGAGT